MFFSWFILHISQNMLKILCAVTLDINIKYISTMMIHVVNDVLLSVLAYYPVTLSPHFVWYWDSVVTLSVDSRCRTLFVVVCFFSCWAEKRWEDDKPLTKSWLIHPLIESYISNNAMWLSEVLFDCIILLFESFWSAFSQPNIECFGVCV